MWERYSSPNGFNASNMISFASSYVIFISKSPVKGTYKSYIWISSKPKNFFLRSIYLSSAGILSLTDFIKFSYTSTLILSANKEPCNALSYFLIFA